MAVLEFNTDLEIMSFSDVRYDNLTALIKYKGEDLMQVVHGDKFDELNVEIHALPNESVTLPLKDLVAAIELASDRIKLE
jgi:UDP-2,3-diacylglucosamine pyrophosphatase LpxH